MTQKEYRRMLAEGVLSPLFINMIVEGMLEEFELEEDENDDTLIILKVKTKRPDDLEDVTIEEVEDARKEEAKLKD